MDEALLLIVRHPETEANTNGRFVGRNSSPFTAQGVRQLRRLPRKIAHFAPQTVWASPLERALLLGRRAAALANAPLHVDDRLLELDFGDAECMTWEEIAETGMVFNYRNYDAPVAPGGESRHDIEARSASAADEIVALGGRHAIVTHGGVVRSMIAHLLGLGPDAIWSFRIANAQMTTIRVIDGHGQLEEYVQG